MEVPKGLGATHVERQTECDIIIAAAATVACSSAAFAGEVTGFNGWGVHGGSVTVNPDGSITGNHGDSELDTPKYHWNKSDWTGRNGRKAFYSTAELNGRPVSDILSIDYAVSGPSDNRDDVYFNIMIEDAGGARAILAPRYLSDTSSGFSRDGTAGPQRLLRLRGRGRLDRSDRLWLRGVR